MKTGIIISGLVLGILFLPGLPWADTDIDKAVVRQLDSAFMPGPSRTRTTPIPIPWSEVGARASMQTRGRGISIRASESGACLESLFQRLAGEVGIHGLQLWSTVKDEPRTRFSVLATGLGRRKGSVAALEGLGRVEVEKDLVRFVRNGLIEEYTVSVDGVRQDLVIAEPPPGNGDLRVELSVTGATAQPSDRGATLILQDSRRQLSYHRLRVLDARNRRLPARLAVESPRTLAVTVADTEAVYPIRIDPTFSDADWHGMGFTSGSSEEIYAVAVTSGGDVYVGGSFTEANGAPGDHIARWDGTYWYTVGTYGANNSVMGLMASGSDLYVCGHFTTVGEGTAANRIAKWDGDWSPLGGGANGLVNAVAMDGDGNLYAGGSFTEVDGGTSANYVAKWDGSAWSALGSGVNSGSSEGVYALAVDDLGNLIVGGAFTAAGGVAANNIAIWNGSSWSAMGSGVNDYVNALASYGGKLYAGGKFTQAGGNSAFRAAYAENLPIFPGVYYVDNVNGDDANNGRSEANAWETFHYAVDRINGGSTGTYTLNVLPGSSYNVDNGETDAELTISQDNVSIIGGDGTAVIDGNGATHWTKGIQITGSQVELKNLSITNFSDIGEKGVYIDAGSGNDITGCKIYGNKDGIFINESASNCTISNCELYDNSYHGIYLYLPPNCSILENSIYATTSPYPNYGLLLVGCSPKVKRNQIRNMVDAVYVQASGGNEASPEIWNNLIHETALYAMSNGIVVSAGSGATGSANPKIYHNTIVGGTWRGIKISYEGSMASSTLSPEIMYNNITGFHGTSGGAGGYGIVLDADVSGDPVIDYNDVWNNVPGGNYNGCSAGSHDITPPGNPEYEDPASGNYNLKANGTVVSPCINAIPTGNPPNDPVTVDLNGDARPYGAGFDMGCYENDNLPAVTTSEISSIGPTSASSGGEVTSSGSETSVTEKGVCWSTSAAPTVDLPTKTTDGTGIGAFTSVITGLTPNTNYHVRAYATNALGITGYGSDKSFTTSGGVPAGTYYVNVSTGDDSNDGSAAHPWKTIHHAIAQINAGGAGTYVLHVALGTYRVSPETDAELVLTQDNVIIIGERGSGPIINGTGAQSWTKGLEVTGSNVTIENLYVTGFSDTGEEGIRISGGTGNEIRYCNLYGNNWGIRVNEASQTTIRNCDIHENTTHGIDDVLSTGTTVVENRLHNNTLYAVRTQSSSEISRNLIYDNTFGILVELINGGTESPTIKNNVIYEVDSGAMSYGIYIRAQNSSSSNPLIYHNTIDGGVLDGVFMEEDGTGSSAPVIKYNIITNFGQYGIENSGADPTIDYNDVWNNTAGNYAGCQGEAHDINENPLYASYSLQPNSPCINTIPAGGDPVTLDYPGYIRPRPGKNTKDMGAYEYVADVTDNYTLPGGTGLATDYRIFTVPLDLGTGARMLSAMEDVLGTYAPSHWRGFLFDGTSYREFNSSQFKSHVIKPGMGFWIITTYTDTIPFEGKPAPDGVNYVMELDPGWHMIGLPWLDTSIFLSSIKVTDGVNTYAVSSLNNNLTQKLLWDYTGAGGYVQRTAATFRLQDNKGYFFRVLADGPIRMIIPNAANQAQANPAVETDPGQTNVNEDKEEPPPLPGAEPSPDIKVNGQDGPVAVHAGDSVSVSIGLDPGAWSGRNADWWVAAYTPSGLSSNWHTYKFHEGWRCGIHVCAQTTLFELAYPFCVLNEVLPSGSYTFYFAVDGNMDGKPDVTWMDSVQVNVE